MADRRQVKTMKMELLENAIDFIVVGVEIFFAYEDEESDVPKVSPVPFGYPVPIESESYLNLGPIEYKTVHQRLFSDPVRRRKHAMLNLFSGVLLLLKESLHRIHPNLLYKDVGRIPKDGRTIDFDETLRRVQAFVGKDVLSEYQCRLLGSAQRIRNSIEHYALDESRHKLDNIIPRLVEFADEFASGELGIDILLSLDYDTREHVSSLKKIAHRLELEEKMRCRGVLKRVDALTDDELRELGDVEPYHPKHNPDPVELLYCEECGEHSVRIVEEGAAGVCTRPECRGRLLMTACLRCEEPIPYEEVLCESCTDYLERQ